MPKAKKSFWASSFFERSAAALFSLAILLIWEAIVPILGLSSFVLPTPSGIVIRIIEDYVLIASHTYITLLEVLMGFAVSVAIGIPLAMLIFYSRFFERALYPIMVFLQTVPKVALAPLLVLYLGYGWAPKIALAFLISFFPIVIATVVGLQALERGLVYLARSMGATELQVFLKVRLPAALPSVFGGFKVAISLAVIGAVIGEYVAAERGLGYLQISANEQLDTTLNFATVVVISLLGVGLYYVIDIFEKLVSFHSESAK